jgi:hypothetical protein
VQKISEKGKVVDWLNEDQRCYEIIDRGITAAMMMTA